MRKPLRIALISEHASPLALSGGVDSGGQNVYVAQVARCLAKAGHLVDVLTRRDDRHTPTVSHMAPGVRVVQIDAGPPCFIPKEAMLPCMPAFTQACQTLVRHGPAYDLVHANFFMSGMVARDLKQRLGLPYVVTFHALGLVRREHQKQADAFPLARIDIERQVAEDADAVIAECPQDELDLTRLYGTPNDSIRMVPCGFDSGEFGPQPRAAARRALGIAPHEFVILQLGRMVPRKGIDNVIRALARLPRAIPARLMVVGGDDVVPDESRTPEIGRLRQLARQLGVEDRVVFTGRRQRRELRDYYAAANVFATTPWYEPFGITPLEAMACGVPVVASAVGGLQYSVIDEVTGLLVPAKDPGALAQALTRLQASPRLARDMGQAGLQRVRSMFTWERVSSLLLDVYGEVLSRQACRHDEAALRPLTTGSSTEGVDTCAI
jgi:glycosyltransferase involved in cell wall biosynthesis